MTNWEKYKDDIIKAVAHGNRVGVKEGKFIKCDAIDCTECICYDGSGCCGDHMVNWLNAEYVEPEVDWSKVPIDTKVLCRNSGDGEWVKRYYAGINEDGNPCVFGDGRTSWSAIDHPLRWKIMKLAEEE